MQKSNVPAHHMPLAYFAKAVHMKKLTNHGRGWEAFFNGCSLGFSDGTREEAIKDVHHREVNNALYLNLPEILASDLPCHMPQTMPSAQAVADHPDLSDKFAAAIASKPFSRWTTPLTKDEFYAYIKASFAEMNERIRALVDVPEGHVWGDNGSLVLRWFGNDPLDSTLSGMQFHIRRQATDENDDSQFMVEVRYFWQGQILQHEDGGLNRYRDDKHSVTLWCQQGRPFYLMHKSLLPDRAGFFYNDTVEGLAAEVAAVINGALAAVVGKEVSACAA